MAAPASELLKRNLDCFQGKKIIACGYFPDTEIMSIAKLAEKTTIWLTDYTQVQTIASSLGVSLDKTLTEFVIKCSHNITIVFAASISDRSDIESDYDTGLLYITKTKLENKYYVEELADSIQEEGSLYVVGANDEGIRGMETLLKNYGSVQKYDNARKCLLLSLYITTSAKEKLTPSRRDFHYFDVKIANTNIKVACLPGIFSFGELDKGTALLLETIYSNQGFFDNKQNALDVGCGSGVISAFIKLNKPDINISACDINAFAIKATIETAKINNIDITVFCSDMLNNAGVYDLIVSNPPFHAGIRQIILPTISFIESAPNHLKLNNGKLFIVANSFLPYADIMSTSFNSWKIINQNNKFKIYEANN